MAKGSGRFDKVPMLLSFDDHSEYQNADDQNASDIELQGVVTEGAIVNRLPADGDGHREAAGGGKHEYQNLLRSGPLGMCNDPYCTTCPYTNVGAKADLHRNLSKHAQEDETSGWLCCFHRPSWSKIGVLNPHSKAVQIWNKIFVVSRLLGIFLDPLFFFLLSVDERYNCIELDYNAASVLTSLRSLVDFIYLIHIFLQFRVAYKDETGNLVDDPKLCKARYLKGWFLIDVIACLPLPQIMVMLVIPNLENESATAAGSFKDMFRLVILFQNIPRFVRFFLLIAGRSPTGFVFETAWANFILNLFLYVLVGHVVGSCWYLFSVQRVNNCFQDVCSSEDQTLGCRKDFLDCGTGTKLNFTAERNTWINKTSATNVCLSADATFPYGIYQPMGIQVAQRHSLFIKYIYSLYWGFLQISTLAGNLTPSMYAWEVVFTMGIGGLGLLMFASLIGSMQNFLQALGRRRQEMQMRRYDVENFMERRRLPLELRKQVRLAERFRWVATHGVEDDEILNGFSEDLQIKIKSQVCGDLLKEVRLFKEMEKEVKSAIFERLHQKVFVTGCKILRKGRPAKRMYFILHGSLSCVGQSGFQQEIGAGQFCGEELLIWHLEQKSDIRSGLKSSRSGSFWAIGQNAISSQEVECQENVDAFVLEGSDVEYITKHYGRLLRTPRVRGILRNDSTSCRLWAAIRIQAAWRYRARKLRHLKAQAEAEALARRRAVPPNPSHANKFR